MNAPISCILYDWMVERRIVSAVAREMGVNATTLSAELRTGNYHAKFGANDLARLCEAVRNVGYGRELLGLLHPYVEQLMGRDHGEVDDRDYVPSVLSLTRCVGLLSESATRISQIDDRAELIALRTMIRTELVGMAMRMDAIVDARLAKLSRKQRKLRLIEMALQPRLDHP